MPAAPDAVVLQVQAVGGEHADRLATALPSLVLYADGRVFTPAPMIMIAPGPALPTWNVQEIDPSGVQAVIDRALAAGIAEPGEVGSPATGEARLRVTLTTAAGTHVRDVRLSDAAPVGLDALDDQFLEGGVPWAPAAVAAVVQPWADLPDLPAFGAGAGLYADVLKVHPDFAEEQPDALYLGQFALARLAAGNGLPDSTPLYLRESDAQVPGPRKRAL